MPHRRPRSQFDPQTDFRAPRELPILHKTVMGAVQSRLPAVTYRGICATNK
jgi:hypothetical protein